MKIHTPTPYGLGILAGLEDHGTFDNPYDDYFEKYDHERWDKGYEVGQALGGLVTVSAEEDS